MTTTVEGVIESLPWVLTQRPDLRYKIYGILEEHFPPRAETNLLLKELKEMREESNRQFARSREESDKRFEKMDERFAEMREETNRQFAEMREESDKRFEKVDERFAEMREESDKRFEKVDERFEKMDERFVEMREESDKRFEKMDERFERVDKSLVELRKDMTKHSEETKKDMTDHKRFVNQMVGGFGTRAGENIENMVAGTLRYALGREEIYAKNLKLRQKLKDDEGLIGPKGRKYEYDIYSHNGELMIFEVKSFTNREAVERFNDKVELFIKLKKPEGKVNKVIITLDRGRAVVEECKKLGVHLPLYQEDI